MNTLHLIRMPVDLAALHRIGETRALTRNGVLDEGALLHHLLSESLGKGALQPFRLMVAPKGRTASLYGYSSIEDSTLRENADSFATPETAAAIAVSDLLGKPLPLKTFRSGKRLGFDVKLRPVVRLKKAVDGYGAGAELDAFQALALKTNPVTRDTQSEPSPTRAQVYLDWLEARLKGAAELERDATRLAAFQRVRVLRGKKLVEGPEAVFHGTLTVTDPQRFGGLLQRGVGRHRAYGYGMLLLRPPQPC